MLRHWRHLVDDLAGMQYGWRERLLSRRGSAARRLLSHLLSQPAISVPHVEQLLGVAQSAAQRTVQQLEEAGIVATAVGGRRNRMWVAGEVIDALDGFAGRVGRRS